MSAALPLEQTATLHERTVQKIARNEVEPFHRTSRQRARPTHLRVARVHPLVWSKVKRLAKHPSHIQIISETKVVVWDRPVPLNLR